MQVEDKVGAYEIAKRRLEKLQGQRAMILG